MVIIDMALVVSMYTLLFQNVAEDCSFLFHFLFFRLKVFLWNGYLLHNSYYKLLQTLTSYYHMIGTTNAVLYKLKAFIKNNTLWYSWK